MESFESDLSAIFEAVGGKQRARLILALREGAERPSKLSHKLDVPLPNLYRIFNELKEVNLVESIEKEGIVYWALSPLGERWLNANISALSEKVLKTESKHGFWRRQKRHFPLYVSLLIFSFALIRGLMVSQSSYIIGGLMLAVIVFVVLEKVK
ncbi:MAG: winged helix-turn-helix domain-containing protein [Nitrososphaeria archaeon]